VATAGTSVAIGATEKTKNSKAAASVPPSSASVLSPRVAPAPVAQASFTSLPVASPPITVTSSFASSPSGVRPPVAPAATVKAEQTRVIRAEPAEPKRPAPAASGYRGGLMLSSSPQGAEVLVNGQVVGHTPVVLNDLPVGSRGLVVRLDGYSPWSTSVRIVANQRTAVHAPLRPVQ
jgi:PEGA domain-containing protein